MFDKVTNEAEVDGKSTKVAIDPESESKLSQAKEDILLSMQKERPRFVSAFEHLDFEGNKVKLAVPSEALRDELIGQRYDILTRIAEIAGVRGALDMFIEVKDIDFKLKPVKIEDKELHMRKVVKDYDYLQTTFDTIAEG